MTARPGERSDAARAVPPRPEREAIARALEAGRRRTLDLLAPLDDEALLAQHSPLMSPLAWDLAHIGNYEDQWLVRATGGVGVAPDLDDIYDAFRHPRPNRPQLPLLPPLEARAYLAEVRARALDRLDGADLDGGPRLLRAGFVHGMVVQHEHQHDETMLATLQLMAAPGYRPDVAPPPPSTRRIGGEVAVPAGTYTIGADDDPWAYDNERPHHTVELDAFHIDVRPVTNAEFAQFVEEGGYHDQRLWAADGWEWRQQEGLEHPQFWIRDGFGWSRDRFGRIEPLPGDEPVQHVCWHEADAFARWAGKRLPTEQEWEVAASFDPATGRRTRHPWGDTPARPEVANLGQRHFGPSPVGAYPRGASPLGCEQMVGDVWEWTSSDFDPYPGFETFPYREYSEVFFGSGYKVLRGGSWATDPSMARVTFRNWDWPIRRQIFAGFRCARGG